jgi:hypothetical protein
VASGSPAFTVLPSVDLGNLPTDTALLHRLVRDIVGSIEHRDSEIGRLEAIVKQASDPERVIACGSCNLWQMI